jgi:branched-subunit amino acid transport protein
MIQRRMKMLYNVIAVTIMILVTYIPRAFPLAFIHHKIKSNFIKSFLFYVPYAVLSALTFPSIIYATQNIYSAILGSLVGLYFAYKNKGLIFVAMSAVLTSLIVGFIL